MTPKSNLPEGVTTETAAAMLGVRPATLRQRLSLSGSYFGIVYHQQHICCQRRKLQCGGFGPLRSQRDLQ